MRVYESVLDVLGRTPLVRLNKVVPEGPPVYAKVEAFNPGGSVKDRIGIQMVEAAEAAGELLPGGTIVEGTSGNTGVGLALVAALKGYRVVFTMPDKMAVEKERLLRAYGAEVVRCPTNVAPDDPRSYYSVAARIAEETENAIYPNQYFNAANPEAHVQTTGPEIWEDTDGRVTHFIAGVGTGGTISGTGRFLKSKNPEVRIIGADPTGSILKHVHETGSEEGSRAEQYLIEGIGEDLVPSTVWFDVIDHMVEVGDKESFDLTRRLAIEEGLLCGSSSGAAVAGVHRALDQGLVGDDAFVVVLLPDTGERYLSKAFNHAWLRSKGLEPPAARVADAAVTPLPAVGPEAGVDRILQVADSREVPLVAVVEDDRVLGVVRVDQLLAELVVDTGAKDWRAERFAGPNPPSVDAATPLRDAAASLAKHEAILVTRKGKPHGLLTRRLALAHLGRL